MADDKKRDHLNDILIEWAPMINMHATKLNQGGLPPHIDPTDLHSAGMHGLIDAFHKYDLKRGVDFATYASRRIKGKMLDHVTSSGGENAVDNYHYKQAKKFMNQGAQQSPSPEQPAQQMPKKPDLPKLEEDE